MKIYNHLSNMIVRGFLTLAITLVAFIPHSVVAHQQAVYSKEIFQPLYSQNDTALKHKDVDAVMKLIAPGYQSFDEKGSVHIPDRGREQSRLVRVFSKATEIESKTTVQSVSFVGKNAIVVVDSDYTRTQTDPTRNLIGKLHEVGIFRELWVNTAGAWQRKRSRTLHLITTKTINGQEVN